jgi:hypothetical protein
MTDDGQAPETRQDSRPPVPSAIGFLFAAVFGVAMLFNLYMDRNPTVTIFLGSATLLILGVDVGRIIGRR